MDSSLETCPARAERVDPVIVPARRVPWTAIAVTLTVGVVLSVVNAIEAILGGDTVRACAYTAATFVLGGFLFPALTHLEMES